MSDTGTDTAPRAGFWRLAEADGSWTALIDDDGTEVSAGELLARSNQLARGLQGLGCRPGDTVAVLLPNCREFIELYLAALQVGLIFTPINHHLVGPEIAYIVDDSEAAVLVGHDDFAEALVAAVAGITLGAERRFAVGTVEGFSPLSGLGDGEPTDAPDGRTTGMAMHYTSGTTGRPKGVRRELPELDPSDMGELYSMFQGMFGVEPFDGNVHLTGSPLYHTAVLMWTANSLHMGHTVVLMNKWDATRCLELIDRYGVTTSHMVPTQFHRMLALPDDVRDRYDMSSTRCMVHAAAPCPPEIKKRMIDWWGNSIMEYYAATEGGGTIITAEEWLRKKGSVGKAWAGAEIRIYDDEANRLGPGEVGTIYMALSQANFEYKGDKTKTEGNRIYEADGAFFTVGDVGELDDDGYLFLRDRKIDMIISGGVNIYPSEIESAFTTNPAVADVAVFGIPNDDWGEEVKAVIEPADGYEADESYEAELRAWAEANLASYKRPRSYDFTTEMPRDPSGKLYKRRLRDPYWEGRAQI